MYTRMAALRKIVKEKLDKPDQLNYDLFERETRVRLNEAQFKPYLYAFRSIDGPQLLPELAEIHPFQTVKDYDNWISRINSSGMYIDQWIVLLGQGAAERRTQPRSTIAKVLEQIKPQLVTDPESQPLLRAVQEDSRQHRRRKQGPAHRRGQACGTGRGRAGVPAPRQVLPRGLSTGVARHDRHLRHARWRAVLQRPDEVLHHHRQPDAARIHNIGLEEVKRIRAEMEKTLEGINFLGTLDQFLRFHPQRPARVLLQVPGRACSRHTRKTAARSSRSCRSCSAVCKDRLWASRPIPRGSAPDTTTAYYHPAGHSMDAVLATTT
jgi:uncharacterized protein (DUF885 family)